MVAMAKVRRLRGKLNILGARFYDGFGQLARLLLVWVGQHFWAGPKPPPERGLERKTPGIVLCWNALC